MLAQFNFWLTSILLPWTYLQRLIFSDTTPHAPCRIPAEWEPHRRTLMAWPERISVDRDDQLHRARTEIANIAETIARYEPVWLYSKPGSEGSATNWVSSTNITIVSANLEQPWIRDSGTLLAECDDGTLVDFEPNYDYSDLQSLFPKRYDAYLAAQNLKENNVQRTNSGLTSLGSALEVDEYGTLLVTEGAVADNTNHASSMSALESRLREQVSIKKTIWLSRALSGHGPTTRVGGDLARFAPNSTVLLSRPNIGVPATDSAWYVYAEAKAILQASTNPLGHHFKIIEIQEALEVPYANVEKPSQRPVTSYLTYYLANGVVIVPQFGVDERADEEALRVLGEVWTGKEVVGVKVDMLAWMGGGVRGATLQWPSLGKDGDRDGVPGRYDHDVPGSGSDEGGDAEGREDEL